MREPDPYLTPARVGLILVAVLVFSVIFARIIAMREQADVRAEVRQETRHEGGEPVTQGIGGIRGLRGSLD
jgi:hypothetical protein